MARIPIYENSFAASVLSICGYGLAMTGLIIALNENIVGGFSVALIGVVLHFGGVKVSEDKQFRIWKEKIEATGVTNRIKEDVNVAIMVYNSNPGKKTLTYISKLNPTAGKLITEEIRSRENQQQQ